MAKDGGECTISALNPYLVDLLVRVNEDSRRYDYDLVRCAADPSRVRDRHVAQVGELSAGFSAVSHPGPAAAFTSWTVPPTTSMKIFSFLRAASIFANKAAKATRLLPT